MRLFQQQTAMLLVDVQERLFGHIEGHASIEKHLLVLLQGLQSLDIPIVCNQQYTKGLGETIESIRTLLGEVEIYEKRTFSCCQNPDVMEALKALHVKRVIVAGVESHVCVLQSVLDLVDAGFEVIVCADAMGSRKAKDHDLALLRMSQEGARMGSVESLLFELLRSADHAQFKTISNLVKAL
ncbi:MULTISPECIES: isochorismatase family protein [unclassified Sulfurospirillum]|uniref:isochorismatase family protein n=1 Tax=unclassified Sulfurospirillum TaxID=2618290 RepID=UPI000502A4E4|nr:MULTISPECIES: isochorismatase family protein [unclassified Sulfurospirillum]KFL34455.1 isochorismatase [Sulfurospirillum sp. SCADC]